MTLREKLVELGGVGTPVKIGFQSSWVYCGRLCENYEKLIDILYKRDRAKNTNTLNERNYHLTHFDEYWQRVTTKEMADLEDSMDYEKRAEEYRKEIKSILEDLEVRVCELRGLQSEMNKCEPGDKLRAIKDRINSKARIIYSQRAKMRERKKDLNAIDGKHLTDEEKQEKRDKLLNQIATRKRIDHEKTLRDIDRISHDLYGRPEWLERFVTECYDSIDPDEISGTKCIACKGITNGDYWFSGEMDHDEEMQQLIEAVANGGDLSA